MLVSARGLSPERPLPRAFCHAHHHALWPETFRLRFGRIHRENGGHGELVHELAVDQQAFEAAAFDPETHAFVEA